MNMQIVPASAQLAPRRSRQAVGYRVLDLNRKPVVGFTRDRVGESTIPGNFFVAGGVQAPDAGGYIVWGLDGDDFAEATIDPAPPPVPAPIDNSAQLAALGTSLQSTIAQQLGGVQSGIDRVADAQAGTGLALQKVAEYEQARLLAGELRTLLGGSVGILPPAPQTTVQEIRGADDLARERRELAAKRDKLLAAVARFQQQTGVTL